MRVGKRRAGTWHAKRALCDVFDECYGSELTYNERRHGLMLTHWLLRHRPEALEPVAEAARTVILGEVPENGIICAGE